MGEVIAAYLVVDFLNIRTKIYYWSDTQIVLSWLNSNMKLKILIEHRVKEIQATSSP